MLKKLILLITPLLILVITSLTQAQTEDERWQGPRLLSSPGATETGEGLMVSDDYGYLHVFWAETNPDDGFHMLQYARFDGEIWSDPIDIRAKPPDIMIPAYAPAVDHNGRLHIIWTESNSGPIFYSSAPANDALSARNWERPIIINVPAYRIKMGIDSKGIIHIVYINFYSTEPGIYYIRSEDNGETWSTPLWIDPDISLNYSPNVLQFAIDSSDGLHASWYYVADLLESGRGEIIRYAHSLDGGNSWSSPFAIDVADDDPGELRQPYPGLGVAGNAVHLIWAGNEQTQRENRVSYDQGTTWGETTRIFGELQGQALGDGNATDAAGRLHFFGQIRWPQGVQHATWDAERGWSNTEIIYLIARDSNEGRQGRYHAHSVRAAVRAGNQLVVTFTDEAVGPLYVMYRTLEDVPVLPLLPTPSPTPPPVEATATPIGPTATPLAPVFGPDTAVTAPSNIANGFWLGVVPPVLVVLGAILFRMLWLNRRYS